MVIDYVINLWVIYGFKWNWKAGAIGEEKNSTTLIQFGHIVLREGIYLDTIFFWKLFLWLYKNVNSTMNQSHSLLMYYAITTQFLPRICSISLQLPSETSAHHFKQYTQLVLHRASLFILSLTLKQDNSDRWHSGYVKSSYCEKLWKLVV